MKHLLYIAILFMAASVTMACSRGEAAGTTGTAESAAQILEEENGGIIPFTILDHYFVNNDITDTPPSKITDRATFDRYFGMAAVMGKGGQPIVVDFDKEYIIDVVLPETDTLTTIIPVSLDRDSAGTVTFMYYAKRGSRQSYTIRPCLLLAIDRAYDGPVTLLPQTDTD